MPGGRCGRARGDHASSRADLDSTVQRLLRNDPALATARLGSKDGGTAMPLYLVTDWPGYFPHGPQIVRLLIGAGADPNALTTSRGAETSGPGDETPLHYAASSDDADVAEALIDGGAEYLLSRGADLNWEPDYAHGTPLDATSGHSTQQENVITWLRGPGARSASPD